MANPDVYELYAVRYASNPNKRRHDNFMSFIHLTDPHDLPMPHEFYVWVAKGKDRTFVIDLGSDVCLGEKRGLQFLGPVDRCLEAIGITADRVDDVILTHLHWDHAGNIDGFPRATLHLHDQEMNFATGRHMCHPAIRRPFEADHVCAAIRRLYAGKVNYTNAVQELASGIVVRHVGGHTKGLQIVQVYTRRGWMIVASDALHFYANMTEMNPFPAIFNVADNVASWALMRSLVESDTHIIPGHDSLVLANYPAATERLAGRVIRLD